MLDISNMDWNSLEEYFHKSHFRGIYVYKLVFWVFGVSAAGMVH